MDQLDDGATARWLEYRQIDLRASRQISYKSPDHSAVVRCIPPRDPTRLAYLGYYLVLLLESSKADFGGALVWNRAYSADGSWIYQMAGHIWQRLGANESAPGVARLFAPDECLEAACSVYAAFSFDWDTYLIPAHGDCLIYKHHDEMVDITCRNKAIADRVFHALTESGWNPTVLA